MKTPLSSSEKENVSKGRIGSSVIHIILIGLLFISWFTYPDPPPGQDGVTILEGIDQLVILDQANNENQEPSKKVEINSSQEQKEILESKPKQEPNNAKVKALKEDPNSKELSIKNSKNKDKPKKSIVNTKAPEKENVKPLETAEEKNQKDREAQQAIDNQKEADDKKKLFEDLLKKDKDSNGNSLEANNATDGIPNESILDNLTGSNGTVSGGLSGRDGEGPSFKPTKQERGKVSIKICADESGKVISAAITQKGTSISLSSPNVELARKAALKWKFKKGESGCGFLTFIIKLQ